MRLFDRMRVSLEASTQTERAPKCARWSHLVRSRQRTVCATLVASLVISIPSVAAQKFDYTAQAEVDAQGNIYVSSDERKLIKMADAGHCMEATVAGDKQTIGCAVTVPLKSPAESWQPLQLEIYFKGGVKKTIEPGEPIREWHFWKDG